MHRRRLKCRSAKFYLIALSDAMLPAVLNAASSAEQGHKPDKTNYAKEGDGHGWGGPAGFRSNRGCGGGRGFWRG